MCEVLCRIFNLRGVLKPRLSVLFQVVARSTPSGRRAVLRGSAPWTFAFEMSPLGAMGDVRGRLLLFAVLL